MKRSKSEKLEVRSEKGDQNETFSLPNSKFSPHPPALVPKLRFPEFRGAEGWKVMKLNALLFEAKHRNRSLELGPSDVLSVSGEHGCVNQIEFMGRSYAGVTVKDYHVVEHGDIVYTKSPLKRSPYGIIKENKGKRGIVSTLYAVYRPFPGCSTTYLEHFFSVNYHLNAYLQPLVKKGAKNDMKVNNADVLKGAICAPRLPEQQKIAECLSSVDELIAAQARKLDALKTHKKGLMQQLFPREGETQPRLRFPEFRDAGEWEETTLGNAATFYNGRAYKQEELLESGKYTVLRVGNFFTSKNWYYSDLELDETKYCDDGDLLYAWSASFGPRVWRGEKTIYHYHIWKVVENKGIDRQFLFITLENETEKMKSESANGLGIMHITKGTIESWKTTFPAMPEQQRIADCLTSLDDLIAAQTQTLEALKTHKRGLMQGLFPQETGSEKLEVRSEK